MSLIDKNEKMLIFLLTNDYSYIKYSYIYLYFYYIMNSFRIKC